MRIAVTGTCGQVVTALRERGALAGHEVVALGRPRLDLMRTGSILPALEAAAPDVVVSAAAYTAVDRAEDERGLAHAINATGAGAVAKAARAFGVPLVHLSTDYVFDGKLDRPYRETDEVRPAGVYGTSKLAGERVVMDAHGDDSVVLRLAWVHSPFGANFVKTMLRLATGRNEVAVVDDQVGNPTSALDIADGIITVASRLVDDRAPALRGVFHMTAQGEASWADFAEAIFAISAAHGGPDARVRRVATADYPTRAVRPGNSRLDCSRLARMHGVVLPHWHTALAGVLARLQTVPA